MANDIQDLRAVLFDTLKDLRNTDKPLDLDRAKAVCEVSQTIINSAKAENEYLKITEAPSGSGFIPEATRPPNLPKNPRPQPRFLGDR
jgi:trehalose-6-phosphatase